MTEADSWILIMTILAADVVIFYLAWRLDRAERIVRKIAARNGADNGCLSSGPLNHKKARNFAPSA